MEKLTKRQKARIDLENNILALVKNGLRDDEIVAKLECTLERVQNVRQANNIFRIQTKDKGRDLINQNYEERVPFEGVPFVCHGHVYRDITADMIDCGIAYERR